MHPRSLASSALGLAVIVMASPGCGDDDCTITLTCPRPASGGSGGTGTTGGAGGIDPNKKVDGIGCGDANECQSALCVDGVCCATTCDGTCESCDLTDTEGTCTPHAPGTDPDTECAEGLCSGLPTCATGTEIWSMEVTGTFNAQSGGLDSSGAFVLSGSSSQDISVDGTTIPGTGFGNTAFVVKIDAQGAIAWSHAVRIADIDYLGTAHATVDSSDRIVVSGYANTETAFPGGSTFGGAGSGFFVVALDAGGQHDWTRSFVVQAAYDGPRPTAMMTDGAGNIYIFGTLNLADLEICNRTLGLAFDVGFFGIKLNADGVCQWAESWEADGQGVALTDVALDATSVYITGTFRDTLDLGGNTMSTPGSGTDMFVASLDVGNGAHKWSKNFGDTSDQFGQGIAVHPSGDLLLTGHAMGTIDFGGAALVGGADDDLVLARLTADGAHVTSQRYGDSALQQGRAIAVGPNGETYVAAESAGTLDFDTVSISSSERRPVTAAFSADGTALWAKSLASDISSGTQRVRVAPNGDVVVLVQQNQFQGRLHRSTP